ncbi:hypothetical protein IQ13_0126 [Lacibacter cauensis]|uniref:PIN like domain-containing protein n=1 Tax=Lacibacter cauensis TaxID=510947 RepID=A0A562SUV7_9BACT|nr:PIN domain-containing protein [Lacibacter cauensis]TWI84973.1 hypothetical protein IQ13_0126 [Lacibacter cauensis]
MSDNKDLFYLDKIFPVPAEIFSAEYKSISEIFKESIFVFDTNALLVPFDTSVKNLNDIKSILLALKQSKKIAIPARVAREFAKNRATKLGDLFLSLRQLKNNLNIGTFRINEYPLLDGIENYEKLKSNFAEITIQIKNARENLEAIEKNILSWNWNDSVSLAYKEIFTPETIENPTLTEEEIEADLKFRFAHKIAPGFKDSNKVDEGIGDLIIWHTILAIAKKYSSNVIFVSNDEKNDWFHKQDKIGMYPKFELYDEFRRVTNSKSFAIISFLQFLEMSNAKEDTIKEVKQSLEETKEEENEYYQVDVNDLTIGKQVRHKKFGIGTVTQILTQYKQPIVEINFKDFGRKLIMLSYARLKIIP